MVELDFILDSNHFYEPVEWRGLEVLCTYDNGSIQPNISLEKVTFVNEAAHYIINYIAKSMNGKVSMYNGLPVQVVASEGLVVKTIFDGMIDFKNGFQIVSPVKVICTLKQCDGVNDLEDRLKGLSYGYLSHLGLFNNSDFVFIPTVTKPFDTDLQIISLSIAEYVMFMQARQLVKDVTADLGSANIIGIIADSVYFAVLIINAIKITRKLLGLLLPLPKLNKGMTFRTALTKASSYLGYSFNTTIQDIDLVYLPSNPNETNLTNGIPQSSDYGYNCLDMFELVMKQFNAKIAVVNSVVELHNVSSIFWAKLATYIIPSTITSSEVKRFNIGDLVANKVFTYQKDLTDEWTLKNWTGTNIEVITNTAITTQRKYSLNNGFNEVNFGVALGNYMFQGAAFEVVNIFINAVNLMSAAVTELLGISKSNKVLKSLPNAVNLLNEVIAQINQVVTAYNTSVLKVSAKTWAVPKVLVQSPTANNRDILSAEVIYNRYHSTNSFLPTNQFGQKQLFENIVVPFQFSNFVELLQCSYANTQAGNKQAKVESIKWMFDKDKAEINYWTHEVYDNSLTETIIIP